MYCARVVRYREWFLKKYVTIMIVSGHSGSVDCKMQVKLF